MTIEEFEIKHNVKFIERNCWQETTSGKYTKIFIFTEDYGRIYTTSNHNYSIEKWSDILELWKALKKRQ